MSHTRLKVTLVKRHFEYKYLRNTSQQHKIWSAQDIIYVE